MIKAVIFDIGGVLEKDTDEFAFRRMSKVFNRDVNLVRKAVEDIIPDFQVGKITNKEFFKRLASELKLEIPIKDWINLWRDTYVEGRKPYKEVEKLLVNLRNSKYKLAALSNTESPNAKFNRRNGRYKHFNVVVLSCEVGLGKPNPEIYKLTMKKLGLKPQECVFIDDKGKYLIPAKKLGINTILFRNSKQLKKDLKQYL